MEICHRVSARRQICHRVSRLRLMCAAHIAVVLLLTGCKTQKNIVTTTDVRTDSVAVKADYRTIFEFDSTLTNSTLDFDTLTLYITRPTETIHLRAVKGRMSDTRKSYTTALEGYARLGSVAYKNAASTHTVDKTVSSAVYTPPNGTIVCIASVLAVGGLLYFLLKR